MNFYEKVYKRFAKLIIWFFRITIVGGENEPQSGGFLACANHISNVDVLSVAVSLKRQVRYMAKKELFKIPLLKNLITALGAFPVDRKSGSAGSIKKAIKLLEDGNTVGMFLQGKRYHSCELESTRDKVKGGAAMTAYHAKVPVLPMYIQTKNARVRLFRPITVYIGKPIAYEEFGFVKGGSAEYEHAAMLVFERILELKHSAENKNV